MLPTSRTPGDVDPLPHFDVSTRDVEGFFDELHAFHEAFRPCFERSEPRDHFFRYMVGQFSSLERKSIEPIALQGGASTTALNISSFRKSFDRGCLCRST